MNGLLETELLQTAARLVVEEGLEYGAAKHRAVKQLKLPARTALPDNESLEAAVREYIALFCADTQPAELAALRDLALVWMDRLQEFQPLIGGAIWHGTATRLSDIYLQLFSDDPKAVEIVLLNQGVDYEATRVSGLQGAIDALSIHAWCEGLGEDVGVHLLVNDTLAQRGALQPDSQGRRPRGNAAQLRERMQPDAAS